MGGLWLTSRRNATSVVGTAITKLARQKHHRHENCRVSTHEQQAQRPGAASKTIEIPNAGTSPQSANVTNQQGQRRRGGSAPNTLRRPGGDEHRTGRQPADRRRRREPTNPAISPLAAEQIAHLAAHQQRAAERQRTR